MSRAVFAALAVAALGLTTLMGAALGGEEPVPDLDERLVCEEEPVRYHLAAEIHRALSAGKGKTPSTRTALDRLLADQSARVRRAAAAALGRLGDKDALGLLVKAGDTGDSGMLEAVTRARVELGDDGVADGLAAMLSGEDEPKGLAAARTMASLGDEGLLRLLGEAAAGGNARKRLRALFGLGFSRKPEGLEALVAALGDADAKVRETSSDALGRRGAAGAAEKLLALLRDDPEPAVRRSAANSLGLMRLSGAMSGLVLALGEDKDASVRSMAAVSLGSIGNAAAKESLLKASRAGGDPAVRLAAVRSLARLRDKEMVGEFIGMLRDDDAAVRHAALGGLAQFADELAARPIARVLKTDPDANCRASAVYQLGRLHPEGLSQLLTEASIDKEAVVRLNAVAAIAMAVPPDEKIDARAAETITARLADEDPSVRSAALGECARLGIKAAADKAVELLRTDPSDGVRRSAARATVGLGYKSKTVPALIDALADKSDSVRSSADAALRTISGKRFGFNTWDAPSRRAKAAEAWRQWWKSENTPPL